MHGKIAPQPLVVVVDDDRTLCALTRRWLEGEGYTAEAFHNGASCLAGIRQTLPDAICLDINMPGMDGLETLAQIKQHYPLVPVLMLTAETAVESVVSAMQLGAYDYLVKPIDRTRLATSIKNAVDKHSMSIRLNQLEREADGRGYSEIVGDSEPMKALFRQLDRIVASDITVLINGESGTGKELVARAIHENCGRRGRPFVPVNCSAIPETLQESELFGHVKGAFTGATSMRIGKFEQADHGTIFLDEVAELSPALQAKLLRVLQERSFQRVGGNQEISSDFRLVAATHKNLEEQVRLGAFREDLYFRVAVFEVELPPLRYRREDIPLLATSFLERLNSRQGREVELSPEAMEALYSHSWPGNVRELQNAIERACVASDDDRILPSHLPSRVLDADSHLPAAALGSGSAAAASSPAMAATTAPGIDLDSLTLEEIERRFIDRALRSSPGNLTRVCRRLGISRATIYRKIKKYELRWETDE